MTLSKKESLYNRDENGNLLPLEVSLEINEDDDAYTQYGKSTIKVIPIPRGKLKRLFSNLDGINKEDVDLDGEIILEHCFEPKYTKEEIIHLKPILTTAIVNTILRESGLAFNKSRKKAMLDAEDDFAKN